MKNEKVVGIYQRGGVSCDNTDDRISDFACSLFLHYSDHPRPDCRLLGNADDRRLTLPQVSIMKINRISFVLGLSAMLLFCNGYATTIAGHKPDKVKDGIVRLWLRSQIIGTKVRSSHMEKRDDHYILTINSRWLWKKSTTKFKIREVGKDIHIEQFEGE